MELINLLIIYNDGTEKVITGVEWYENDSETRCFKILKNSHYLYVPVHAVRFFGRVCDYENSSVSLKDFL